MPDWRKIVREKLGSLPLDGGRQEEVIDELAQQLEICLPRSNRKRGKRIRGQVPEPRSIQRGAALLYWVARRERPDRTSDA